MVLVPLRCRKGRKAPLPLWLGGWHNFRADKKACYPFWVPPLPPTALVGAVLANTSLLLLKDYRSLVEEVDCRLLATKSFGVQAVFKVILFVFLTNRQAADC
ncbi:hypothetical protein GOODEAATRI_022992 [Goodea atripinnis]|uniref:Uncharacterized protein n=1 Tax=Goodea atripinnis TaxID=208336 RepID=A0ABV0N3N3_9TELE